MAFFDIAAPLIARGIKVIRLRPRTKIAFDSDWPTLATTDKQVVRRWSDEMPDANCACVADKRLGGLLFVEIDDPDVIARYSSDTGQKLPNTFRVRSSPGRGHLYLSHTAYSLEKLSNISQGSVKFQDFSARVDAAYCVSPGSLHPKTGLPYEIMSLNPILEIPNVLVDWILTQKVEKIKSFAVDNEAPIISGGRNSTLASLAGKARQVGLNNQELESYLLRINDERCQPPLSSEEVKVISASISRYPVKDDTVLVGGLPAGTAPSGYQTPTPVVITDPEDLPTFTPVPYPRFPAWVMSGTSIYEGLVKPFCAVNSRYPEFMFMPAMALMLNYIGTKVRIEFTNVIPSIFLALIGRRGQVIKSSSVEDAIAYFQYAGIMDHAGPGLKNAEGKALVWSAGSPEGLGIDMARLNCRNAVLFYDELSTLTNKASIETSTLTSSLLTLYESGKFQNAIKSRKESFSLDPGTYCASLIVCSTDKNFLTHWAKLSGRSSGLDDRFFFLLQPENLKPVTPQIHVSTQDGAIETRKRIDAAIAQGVYAISDKSPLNHKIETIGNRGEIRAEKFALGFAIDLGLSEIDEDCLERALALVDYERAVKRYLAPFEATSREGSLQMELLHLLRKNNGSLAIREMRRILHPERHGSSMWGQAYSGLIKNGSIREEGSGGKSDPKRVVLLRAPEEDDD